MKNILLGLGIAIAGFAGWAYYSWLNSWHPLETDLVTEYREQTPGAVGRVAVVFTGLVMPERIESHPEVFLDVSEKPERRWPWPVSAWLADSHPTVLMDEERFYARESFEPQRLMDAFGSDRDASGTPYIDKYHAGTLRWVAPRDPLDFGHFEDDSARSDWPTYAQKPTVKARLWYYGTGLNPPAMPHEQGLRTVVEMASEELRSRYNDIEVRQINAPKTAEVRETIHALLDGGVETLVLASTHTSLSTFKLMGEWGSLYKPYYFAREWQRLNGDKELKILIADSLGDFQPMRDAFVTLLQDRLDTLPPGSDVDVVLSHHGMPWDRFPDETFLEFAEPYFTGLRRDIETLFTNYDFDRTRITVAQDLYADDYYDADDKYISTNEAYRAAAADGFDISINLPTTFYVENTDTLFNHAVYVNHGLEGFEPFATIDYPDWSKPLVREFRLGDTRILYNGLPVGPYAQHVADAMVASVSTAIDGPDKAGDQTAALRN